MYVLHSIISAFCLLIHLFVIIIDTLDLFLASTFKKKNCYTMCFLVGLYRSF